MSTTSNSGHQALYAALAELPGQSGTTPESWARNVQPHVERAIMACRDPGRALRQAVEICEYRPSVAEIRRITLAIDVEAQGQERQGEDGGCADCGGSGWREAAVRSISQGRPRITHEHVACDCPKGIRRGGGTRHGERVTIGLAEWEARIRGLSRVEPLRLTEADGRYYAPDGSPAHGIVGWVITSAKRPRLTLEEQIGKGAVRRLRARAPAGRFRESDLRRDAWERRADDE